MKDISNEPDLRVRNALYAWKHIDAESADVIDDIMATLAPDEPYAYTVAPPAEDRVSSIPHQEFRLTRAGIQAAYEDMHRFSLSLGIEPLAEIRSDWYAFIFGLGHGMDKATGAQHRDRQTAVLFPTMGQSGITGELFWFRTSAEAPYTGGRTSPHAAEAAILARHDALVEAFRRNDVSAVVELFNIDAQVGIRDYVNETGTVISITGGNNLELYLKEFFSRFKVVAIDIIQRLATDWCAFAELRWIVEDQKQSGEKLMFYTANHGEVRPDGLFASLIGHGTDPVSWGDPRNG
jgi:hypothetical protein